MIGDRHLQLQNGVLEQSGKETYAYGLVIFSGDPSKLVPFGVL